MPVEAARNIAKRCREGKLSDRMKKLKKKLEKEKGKSLSCTEFGHIVANMIENERKSEGKGGDVPHKAYAYYAQSAKGGDPPKPEERKPFWLSVMDSKTKLRDDQHGPVSVDDIAMFMSKDDWKGVSGHLDHFTDLDKDINITDTRFDFGNGELFFEVKPDDTEIYDGLRSGNIKPSIEIGYWGKDIDEDDYVTRFTPKGLGLMVDGTARGENVGPRDPPSEALGGDNMEEGDETPTEGDKKKEEPEEEEQPDDQSQQEEQGSEEEEEEEEQTEETDPTKKEIEELRNKLKEQNDKLEKVLTEKKSVNTKNKELEEVIINNIVEENKGKYPKDYILVRDNMSVSDVKERVAELDRIANLVGKGFPENDIPPIISKEEEPEAYDEDGNITEEHYKKLIGMTTEDSKEKNKYGEALF